MAEGKVLVVGLGEIGKPLLDIIRESHSDARGVDIEPEPVFGSVSLMHVCYPFDIPCGFVETTLAYAAKYEPSRIAIHSTVVPGTTFRVEEATAVPCVYTPIRGKHARMHQELRRYHKFIAGRNADAVEAVRSHFETLGMNTTTLAKPETLELAKLLETSYFGLLIAWAQQMDRFARELGADYSEAAKFFTEIDYLPQCAFVPGHIGGHCVMPNIGLLKGVVQSDMLDAIERSNARKAAELGIEGPKAERQRIEPLPTVRRDPG